MPVKKVKNKNKLKTRRATAKSSELKNPVSYHYENWLTALLKLCVLHFETFGRDFFLRKFGHPQYYPFWKLFWKVFLESIFWKYVRKVFLESKKSSASYEILLRIRLTFHRKFQPPHNSHTSIATKKSISAVQ